LTEAVRVIAGCFADQPFSHAGAYYTIQDRQPAPQADSEAPTTILVGGGSRRILSIAARHADIVGINFRTTADGMPDFVDITAEATPHKVPWVRQAAGQRFGDIELSVTMPTDWLTNWGHYTDSHRSKPAAAGRSASLVRQSTRLGSARRCAGGGRDRHPEDRSDQESVGPGRADPSPRSG
jgi:alkanesulfonate monooxygenase SsuD/methylene tetrahydromethanopterin reductase-like flavin-dependent oxidoreductase (luciferase family)